MNTLNENKFKDLPSEHEVESRARAIFKSACEGADSYHVLRLGLARRKALDAASARSGMRGWIPLAGAAATCCALVIGVVLMRPASQNTSPAVVASSAPIVSSQVDSDEATAPEVGSTQMEMVQDLDFYRWLAAQPTVASGSNEGGR